MTLLIPWVQHCFPNYWLPPRLARARIYTIQRPTSGHRGSTPGRRAISGFRVARICLPRNIVIATPTSLFVLLRAVALGWRQDDISEKAKTIQQPGRELYTRLNTMGEHFNRVGKQLEKTIESYNATVGSLDSRVMVTARRLAELAAPARTDRHPTNLEQVTVRPRATSLPIEDDAPLG